MATVHLKRKIYKFIMDREQIIKWIEDKIRQLDKTDLISIAHIVDPSVDSKAKIEKDEGLYYRYDAINIDTLQRIYDFIKTKLKLHNIE